MLRAINIANEALPRKFPLAFLHRLTRLEILLSLKTIQQDASQASLEIVFHAHDDLLQEIRFCGAEPTLALFLFEIGVQDAVDRVRGRQRDEGHALGDVFPIIDENRFEMVGKGEADCWTAKEGFFLYKTVLVSSHLHFTKGYGIYEKFDREQNSAVCMLI